MAGVEARVAVKVAPKNFGCSVYEFLFFLVSNQEPLEIYDSQSKCKGDFQ